MSTVVILGAGATKACGGPLTDEILPAALGLGDQIGTPEAVDLVADFLGQNFGRTPHVRLEKAQYPGLPLLLSLLDNALHRREDFHPAWPEARVRKVRVAIEEIVSGLIEYKTRQPRRYHHDLVEWFDGAPTIISLNYDLLADDALRAVKDVVLVPDYGCDVGTPAYRQAAKRGALLKIHGSLNWLYCSACHYLEVRRPVVTGTPCPGTRGGATCGTPMGRVMITPSHMKDYRNPHIAAIWQRAEEALRDADEIVVIGYSLPWDDVEVIYLLRRALAGKEPRMVTVVEHLEADGSPNIEDHDAGRRYAALFGDVNWCPVGFADWLSDG